MRVGHVGGGLKDPHTLLVPIFRKVSENSNLRREDDLKLAATPLAY